LVLLVPPNWKAKTFSSPSRMPDDDGAELAVMTAIHASDLLLVEDRLAEQKVRLARHGWFL
jgi:hypothetical protein